MSSRIGIRIRPLRRNRSASGSVMAAAKGSRLACGAISTRGEQQGADETDAHQRRHGQIGAAPVHELRDVERARAGADQGQAIAELIGGRHHALPLGGGDVDAPAVDNHILRRRCEGDEQGRRDGQPQAGLRIAEGDADQAQCRDDLRQRHPAAPAAEQAGQDRHVVAVDDGRPEKLEGIGERHPAQHADLGARDPRLPQPGRQRAEDEQERQARRKSPKGSMSAMRPSVRTSRSDRRCLGVPAMKSSNN